MRLGPRDLKAGWLAAVADIWGHRQAQVYMGVTVLTESRRRSSELGGAPEDLAAGGREDSGDTRRVAGDAYGVCYSQAV